MVQRIGTPAAQGLYDPANEHDACGVGFIANIDGNASHRIVEQGIEILCRLTHRGAVGADPLDGDGAGITIQIPDTFYRAVVDFDLPALGDYATGLIFLPKDADKRQACEDAFDAAMAATGLKTIGWRDVPTDGSTIGRDARAVEPLVRQVFVSREDIKTSRLELMCYLARRRAENLVAQGQLNGDEYFYVNTFSANRILYKGMLLSDQLATYFPDLSDERVVSSVALVHQRYSTNTFPTWDLAQPFRFVCHNGEINTLRGNVNRMRARQAIFQHAKLGDAVRDLAPVILDENGSDTAGFDNALDLLVSSGYALEHALAMMVPEAFIHDDSIDPKLAEFFQYHATMMEPWDGPANLAAFDGSKVVATLDRNGLRPVRYWVTDDNDVIYASEAGVLDIDPGKIVRKGRLAPGRMMLIDTVNGELLENDAIKKRLANSAPYGEYLREQLISWNDLPIPPHAAMKSHDNLRQVQQLFGYTLEELREIIAPMCNNGAEALGSMGTDTPEAVLSNKSKSLFWYFKQQFAQVTNPPIDPIREELVMSLRQYVGTAHNILESNAMSCRLLQIEHPVLTNDQLEQLRHASIDGLEGTTLDATYAASLGEDGLSARIDELCAEAERKIVGGANVLVVSDRGVDRQRAPIPALLITAALHHHLIRAGKRTLCSLVIETGEAREVMHFALLVGYGATAVNPYLAFDSIQDMIDDGTLSPTHSGQEEVGGADAIAHYHANFIKAIGKGLFKIFSKMGISTLQSYAAAQIFEAVGISKTLIDRYFTGTASRIGGIGISEIHRETTMRHNRAYAPVIDRNRDIDRGGEYSYRRDGEDHLMSPEVIALLQQATQENSRDKFDRFCKQVDDQAGRLNTLRGLFKLKPGQAIPIDEVEPVSAIVKRFCTGAMSLGSISSEAHEDLAIAMNRLGAKSNTGEGGEDPRRFTPDDNGDLRRSHIKQVASGRFGVTPHYLVNAGELQIKICQGAKPGEGGHLPGHKVSEYIANLRNSVPGVSLISPPPHHDIYSIEDLAQLIYDLKNCNPEADITVKLVSIVGCGTVAAGVAKGHADTVIIAGYDGGTGASPFSSIKHAGVPWEIGLAETQQTLVLNDLRGRIRVQTDGQLRTPRDVIIAALLGAEEYAFATIALVSVGCIMMRKCHLGTCPVGVATQDPELRKYYAGKPEYVVNYFQMMAEGIRELLAEVGVRSIDELIGRTELLEMNEAIKHWKSQGLDYSGILAKPDVGPDIATRKVQEQDHGIDDILDRDLIAAAAPALERGEKVSIERQIFNFNRTTGTMLSGQVAKLHGKDGLSDGTIDIRFKGVAGQSFGTFLAPGVNLTLLGEGNDYVGKGMAGGRIAIRPDETAPFTWCDNQIIGNTVLYGATGGKAFFAGRAGERFCVRNSGVHTVVEGVGDHGCEYMTGGVMVCLGETGRNFGAGMSGGFAFVLDEQQRFGRRCNRAMVDLEQVEDQADLSTLKGLIEEHQAVTGSPRAAQILANWDSYLPKFVKVFPHEYRRVLLERAQKQKEVVHG
ncbi:MAG: glutamate synthase large subunit [Planctomycetota bacterium]|jgi:glutamate synthase (NADPH/NADH) large chain/glutamate synthase (ferredoxin)